ncbi:hypothetical protein XFF7767_1010004 [Xanthomonas citri pv. fuscans]|nr:hypothetical protein XFF7767_1010004 [Xanthomonas citri pv. fuscans]SOO01073.1 hypothetical protein XFF6960_430004 [Xanthomonas citri pv. fuscans]
MVVPKTMANLTGFGLVGMPRSRPGGRCLSGGAAKQSTQTSCFLSSNEGGLPEASPALEFP